MKWFLFALFCLLNVYAEGKWRTEHKHEGVYDRERQSNDLSQETGNWHDDSREKHSTRHENREHHGRWVDKRNGEHGHWHNDDREKHGDWQNNDEYDRERHRDRQDNDDYNREKHRNWQNKVEYDRQKHSNWRDSEYRRHHNNDWHRRETANEISTFRPLQDIPDPPDHTKLIPMARYVLHHADWASIATISVQPAIEGFPFTNVKSIVDGSKTNSTGVPYFYMSPLDFTAKDLAKNTRATVLVSLEETRYCEKKNYDPEDPRCTRLMLSGKMKKMRPDTPEYTFAKAALFERHPAMADFPPDHDWFVAKLKIAQIAMVDWFGGAKYIPVREYLAYNYTEAQMPQSYLRTTLAATQEAAFTNSNMPETTVA